MGTVKDCVIKYPTIFLSPFLRSPRGFVGDTRASGLDTFGKVLVTKKTCTLSNGIKFADMSKREEQGFFLSNTAIMPCFANGFGNLTQIMRLGGQRLQLLNMVWATMANGLQILPPMAEYLPSGKAFFRIGILLILHAC